MRPHSQNLCQEPSVAWTITLLYLLSNFPHNSRDGLQPVPSRPVLGFFGALLIHGQGGCVLLFSLIPPDTLSSPGHRKEIAAQTPNAHLCTSFILGICRTQEPTHGAAGLEHLPVSAWRLSEANAGQRSTGSRGCPGPSCQGLWKLCPRSGRYRINI